jgi:hypothetical protein
MKEPALGQPPAEYHQLRIGKADVPVAGHIKVGRPRAVHP